MFLENKYTKWYHQIIENAKARTHVDGYTEQHHIIPTSLGGKNWPDNKVRLTPREHFICHMLLTKMTTNLARSKMLFAFSMLTHIKNIGEGRYLPASRLYEYARNCHSNAMKEWWTPERKVAQSIAKKGRNYITPEGRARNREYQLTKVWSEKAIQNRIDMVHRTAEARRGKPWTEGRRATSIADPYHHTPEWKAVLQAKYKGKRLSQGRRVGHWFRSPAGEEILFCPMKLVAKQYGISVFCLNNIKKGAKSVQHADWQYIRPATKEEENSTIILAENAYSSNQIRNNSLLAINT
jgi:hypothetical protein